MTIEKVNATQNCHEKVKNNSIKTLTKAVEKIVIYKVVIAAKVQVFLKFNPIILVLLCQSQSQFSVVNVQIIDYTSNL